MKSFLILLFIGFFIKGLAQAEDRQHPLLKSFYYKNNLLHPNVLKVHDHMYLIITIKDSVNHNDRYVGDSLRAIDDFKYYPEEIKDLDFDCGMKYAVFFNDSIIAKKVFWNLLTKKKQNIK